MSAVANKPATKSQNNRRQAHAKPVLKSQQAPRINTRVLLDTASFSGLG